jgi:hypothetical protein
MSTTAAAQPILTIIKDEFAEVIMEGILSPTNKPTDWNVVITKKALLEAMRTPSPPPEEIRHGLATLYDNTFPTHKEYCEFTVNRLTRWGNTLDYKLSDTLYMTHRYHSHTIKIWHCWRKPTKSTNGTWWLDMRLKVTSRQSLNPTFDNGLKNHNEFELWFLPHPFLVSLDNRIILIMQPMDETTLNANISVLNVETPHTSNGVVPSTLVEPVIK